MTKVQTEKTVVKKEYLTANKIESKVVEINPMIARQWLDSTDEAIQRRVNSGQVAYLARQMKSGQWELNGEAVIISDTNQVIDGRHRLTAVIESQTSILSLVIFGVPQKSIHTIDQGKPRSISDVYDISYNHKYSSVAASAVQFIYSFQNEKYGNTGGRRGGPGSSRNSKISPPEALDFIEANPGFFEFIVETMKVHNAGDKLIGARVFCGLKWILDEKSKLQSDRFFSILATGVGVKSNGPIFHLRKKLIEMKTDSPNARLTSKEVLAFTIKCWNYFCEGVKEMKFIKIPSEVPAIYSNKLEA